MKIHFAMALVGVWLLVLSSQVEARIGETVDECEGRYGEVLERIKPTLKDSDENAVVFKKNGVHITIEFRKGRAWKLVFRKASMSEHERNTLLAANAVGYQWSDPLTIAKSAYWISDDQEFHAVYTTDKNPYKLVIMSEEYVQANKKQYQLRLQNADEHIKRLEDTVNPLPGF